VQPPDELPSVTAIPRLNPLWAQKGRPVRPKRTEVLATNIRKIRLDLSTVRAWSEVVAAADFADAWIHLGARVRLGPNHDGVQVDVQLAL